MKHSFKDILKKYFKRNKEYFLSDNIVYEMNGVVLVKTNNAIFDFFGVAIDNITEYCKSVGYKPDKIVFISSYDIEVQEGKKLNMKMKADSKISIIEKDNKIIARVCIGEYVSIKNNEKKS